MPDRNRQNPTGAASVPRARVVVAGAEAAGIADHGRLSRHADEPVSTPARHHGAQRLPGGTRRPATAGPGALLLLLCLLGLAAAGPAQGEPVDISADTTAGAGTTLAGPRAEAKDAGLEPSPGGTAGSLPAAGPTGDAHDIPELLVLANQKYLEGNYAEAARGYEAIAALGHANGHIFYNLGNSCVRLGETGKAILNFKKALLLIPRDGDLKANLQYARSLCQDRIEPAAASIWRTLAFWYFGLNLRGLLLGFLLLNGLFWGSLLLKLFLDREWLRWSVVLSLILCLLAAASAAVKARETFHSPEGVILAPEVSVHAGFTRNDTVLFILHEGAEFRILAAEGSWWKVELPDGKKGWLPANAAGRASLGPA